MKTIKFLLISSMITFGASASNQYNGSYSGGNSKFYPSQAYNMEMQPQQGNSNKGPNPQQGSHYTRTNPQQGDHNTRMYQQPMNYNTGMHSQQGNSNKGPNPQQGSHYTGMYQQPANTNTGPNPQQGSQYAGMYQNPMNYNQSKNPFQSQNNTGMNPQQQYTNEKSSLINEINELKKENEELKKTIEDIREYFNGKMALLIKGYDILRINNDAFCKYYENTPKEHKEMKEEIATNQAKAIEKAKEEIIKESKRFLTKEIKQAIETAKKEVKTDINESLNELRQQQNSSIEATNGRFTALEGKVDNYNQVETASCVRVNGQIGEIRHKIDGIYKEQDEYKKKMDEVARAVEDLEVDIMEIMGEFGGYDKNNQEDALNKPIPFPNENKTNQDDQ